MRTLLSKLLPKRSGEGSRRRADLPSHIWTQPNRTLLLHVTGIGLKRLQFLASNVTCMVTSKSWVRPRNRGFGSDLAVRMDPMAPNQGCSQNSWIDTIEAHYKQHLPNNHVQTCSPWQGFFVLFGQNPLRKERSPAPVEQRCCIVSHLSSLEYGSFGAGYAPGLRQSGTSSW